MPHSSHAMVLIAAGSLETRIKYAILRQTDFSSKARDKHEDLLVQQWRLTEAVKPNVQLASHLIAAQMPDWLIKPAPHGSKRLSVSDKILSETPVRLRIGGT